MVEDPYHYGAIIKLACSPSAGHEQGGWRPAIIISNETFNAISNMRIICPITHTDRKSPFHIPISGCKETDGFIMCDQVKSADVYARKAKFIEDAPSELTDDANTLAKECL